MNNGSNFLHRSDSSSYAARLQHLCEERAKLAMSQNRLNHEYEQLMLEMSSSVALQNHQAGVQHAGSDSHTLPHPPPHIAPESRSSSSDGFFIGSFDEDLAAAPALGLEFASSMTTGYDGLSPFDLAGIDAIPFLPAPALPLPPSQAFTASPTSFDLVHVPASNGSGETGSSFSASPFSSHVGSPSFSPFDANNLGSWASPSSGPFHSLGTTCSSFSSGHVAVGWPQPSTSSTASLFPESSVEGISPATFEAQVNALCSSPVFSGSTLDPAQDLQLARMPSQAGKARSTREASFDTSLRFSPMALPTLEYHQRQASLASTASSLLASPEIKPLARNGSKKTRAARVIKETTTLVLKNTEPIFAVHCSNKPAASESPLTRLFLDESMLDPSSPLAHVVQRSEPYTAAAFRLDCALSSVYTFYTAARAPFVVTFSLSGPTISPSFDEAKPSTYSFLHFLPGDVVVQPSELLGSVAWWRLQECRASHAGYPGSGAWTARFDGGEGEGAAGGAEAEKRRPARIYSHFAKCCGKGREDEGPWSLMKLAKAMKGGK